MGLEAVNSFTNFAIKGRVVKWVFKRRTEAASPVAAAPHSISASSLMSVLLRVPRRLFPIFFVAFFIFYSYFCRHLCGRSFPCRDTLSGAK